VHQDNITLGQQFRQLDEGYAEGPGALGAGLLRERQHPAAQAGGNGRRTRAEVSSSDDTCGQSVDLQPLDGRPVELVAPHVRIGLSQPLR
jgi:hypothetical protein